MGKVLVVGGRTTGLMMALELARRGVPTRCIDKSPGIDPHVRANLLHSRTLEILQGLGLDEQVTQGSFAEKGLAFYRDTNFIGFSPHAPVDSPFPYGMSQSQAHTEATLEACLKRFGVEVERSVVLSALTQCQDDVTATLRHDDMREETDRYDWVIGCDGAHSTVRHLLGVAFPGDPDALPYILGDVLIDGDDDLDPQKAHIFFHDQGELYLFTRLPGGRHFCMATLAPDADVDGAPTLQDLQAIVSERSGRPLRLHDPDWLGRFRISYRLAQHYRSDRVFLAGDAAHVHSPLAGQGMNTGLQDAHNLAWKLALVAHGAASAAILDSYEAERRQIGEGVVEDTRQITNTMEQYARLSPRDRDEMMTGLFGSGDSQVEGDRHLQEVDLDYSDSALTLTSDDAPDGQPKPGTRAPDAGGLVADGKTLSLFQLPTNAQYRLFFFCGDGDAAVLDEIGAAVAAAKRHTAWLTPYVVATAAQAGRFDPRMVLLDTKGQMHLAYAARTPCLYLIRPDGYVAYRSTRLASVDMYFEHLKEKQIFQRSEPMV
ncbi:MAG: FAD-dependent monooxygenase [Pseudomonadota bacterium]